MSKFHLSGHDITDQDVLDVLERIPREEFVPEEHRWQAYMDHPLPIGYGQTISQPYIVALMTQLLRLRRDSRVMEIGTGSGYQAAILSQLCAEVYSVEIIKELAASATLRLARLGYTNVHVLYADGFWGWKEHAPYDAIIVTAAAPRVPPPLVEQLRDGGRLVIPLGPPGDYQSLQLIEKAGGKTHTRNIAGVLFVPLTGDHRHHHGPKGEL
jgi:protein-L-isoaspartate(D-aspartate) O-methyltransferase